MKIKVIDTNKKNLIRTVTDITESHMQLIKDSQVDQLQYIKDRFSPAIGVTEVYLHKVIDQRIKEIEGET